MYQADTLGKEFVVLLADVLWYMEGRHDRFNKQAKPIPAAFTKFPRLHLPEQNKHRKAENTQLSAAELQGYSNQLFQKLEQPWLKREAWREVSTAICTSLHVVFVTMLAFLSRSDKRLLLIMQSSSQFTVILIAEHL